MPTVTSGGASNQWEEQSSVNEDGNPVSVLEQQPLPEDEPETEPEPQQSASEVSAESESGSQEPSEPQDAEQLTDADIAAGYTDLSFAQLRAEAKNRGLPAGGSAVELAARLTEHDAATAAPAGTEQEGGD